MTIINCNIINSISIIIFFFSLIQFRNFSRLIWCYKNSTEMIFPKLLRIPVRFPHAAGEWMNEYEAPGASNTKTEMRAGARALFRKS